jgi:hypothetical protein
LLPKQAERKKKRTQNISEPRDEYKNEGKKGGDGGAKLNSSKKKKKLKAV